MNNITVDGSSFNNSFGLGNTARATAPASRRSRRGDRADPGQRRALRRAPGQLRRRRHQHRHAQRHQPVHAARSITSSATRTRSAPRPRIRSSTPAPSRSATPAAGPAARSSRTSCSSSATTRTKRDKRPCTTFRANQGGEPVGRHGDARAGVGPRSRSALPEQQLRLRHRAVPGRTTETPAKRFLVEATTTSTTRTSQLPLQPARLDHRRLLSNSTSLGFGSRTHQPRSR